MIGAGAIGGVLAAAAHSAGHDVTLCARTPFDRFVLQTPDGSAELPIRVVSDPGAVPEVDWILLTTKVQDAGGAAPWLRKLDDGDTPLVIVQNGVEHRESVAGLVSHAPLLPALIYVGAERTRPGHIVRRSEVSMIVPASDLGARFTDVFAEAVPALSLSEDFHTAAWRKLLTNLVANPITALTYRRLDIFGDPDVRQLAEGVLAEAIDIARAEGANLTSADAITVMDSYTDRFPPGTGTSMLYDRLAGLRTEHDHITGPLVQAGRRHGIPTPLNHALLTLMRALRPEDG